MNNIIDKKIAKVIFNKSGGTATGEKAITNRVTIPTKWIQNMNITKEDRDVELIFLGDEIRIKKVQV